MITDLAYPAFLLAAAKLMVAFLTHYNVPRMSDQFNSLSANPTLYSASRFIGGSAMDGRLILLPSCWLGKDGGFPHP